MMTDRRFKKKKTQLACFLTRGDLWQSWEEGARVFEVYLLDADWSLNTGNWLWLSASAFFYQACVALCVFVCCLKRCNRLFFRV